MNQYWGSWGPRVGLAYQLDPRTVVRAAYGLYQTPLKISNFANTDSLGFFAVGYKWPAQVNQQTPAVIPSQVQGYPGSIPPTITPTALNGLSGGGGAASGGPVMLPSRKARPGDVNNWTFDIQRELPGQWLVDMAYVGNHGSHLQALLKDPNVAPAVSPGLRELPGGSGYGTGRQSGLRGTTACCHPLHELPHRLWPLRLRLLRL